MTAELSREELEKEVSAYRGNPLFADLAKLLISTGDMRQALDVCLAGISSNPECHVGRLVLARIFYDLNYPYFCIRELVELNKALPKNLAVKKLLDLMAPGWDVANAGDVKIVKTENIVAEADFEIDVLSDLEKEKNK